MYCFLCVHYVESGSWPIKNPLQSGPTYEQLCVLLPQYALEEQTYTIALL
jgi:hypothetical protein